VTSSPDLERFVAAQADSYATAIAEIRNGAKRTHWMWFIFPQLRGLGRSPMALHYGIASASEAEAYLAHPLLGRRYRECGEALTMLPHPDAERVFGPVDAMKLRSSLTLFEHVSALPLLYDAIDLWFAGQRDQATLDLLA
jgi:uncharacterized protein (DUF1810 family)